MTDKNYELLRELLDSAESDYHYPNHVFIPKDVFLRVIRECRNTGTGYYAFPEYIVRGYEFTNQGLIESDKQTIQWWIVKKEFWEENEYIDDQHLDLNIPNFFQDQESCFSCDDDNLSLEEQSERLMKLGFEVRELGVIDT